jgi:hypothetical protein
MLDGTRKEPLSMEEEKILSALHRSEIDPDQPNRILVFIVDFGSQNDLKFFIGPCR